MRDGVTLLFVQCFLVHTLTASSKNEPEICYFDFVLLKERRVANIPSAFHVQQLACGPVEVDCRASRRIEPLGARLKL
jgi:hypothetical protein